MHKLERNSIIAGLYGNTLEGYDFILYASFAPLFVTIFFPANNPFIALLTTFGVFAIGFLMRPVGGLIIGHYADHVGRRKALILSLALMTVATLGIAILPSFHMIGITAPLLFTLMRLIQGFALGGELPSSATFLVEHMFENKRNLAGSLVMSLSFLGIFAAACTATYLSAIYTNDQMLSYGWRLAYFIGGALGLLGIYLRIKSVEPKQFLEIKPTTELPAKIVFKSYSKQLLMVILITIILALSNYILIAYATTFLVKSRAFSLHDALLINLTALFVVAIFIPVMGFLSDRFNNKIIFQIGVIALLLYSFPFFWLLQNGSWSHALWGEIILALILAPINATVPTLVTEIFPTAIRASGASIGYNIGQAIFGGTLPMVALSLIQFTGNPLAPAYYIFAWAFIVILGSTFITKEKEFANSL